MGFAVHTTPYGEPAGTLLAAQVRALKGGDPLAPVTVIVPATYAGICARRRLARDGVAAVTFVTVQRLAERVAGPALAATGRRPAPPALVAGAVRRVLHDRPGVFAEVAGHPATEDALVAAYQELRGVSEAALDALARRSRRTHDIVAVHRRVRALLAPEWHDEHDLIAAAASAPFDGLGRVVLHLPRRVAPATAVLLGAMAARTTVTVNVGLTGDEAADAPVRAGLARAGIAVPAVPWAPGRAHAVVSATDADEEVRAAVRVLVDAARHGVPFARMALVWGSDEPYARIVEAQLDGAGVPRNGAPVRTVATSVAGRTVRRLLALPDRRFRRSDVMGVLSGVPALQAGGGPVPAHAWERVSREAGVVDGNDWERLLAAYAGRAGALAEEAAADERDALAAHLRADAAQARALSRFVDGLQATLGSVAAAGTWASMSAAVSALLASFLGDGRDGWPDEELRAAERVVLAIEGLGGLDAIGGPPPTVDVFRRSLDASLDAALRRTGRFGDGVLVGPLSVATGLELDVAVVLGLAEGTLPSARIEDSLLPDADRAVTGGELPLLRDAQHDERHRFLAAVASARHVTLCFPRGDLRRPGERVPSRWLADVAPVAAPPQRGVQLRLFDEQPSPLGEPRMVVHEVPSFTGGIRTAAFAPTEQEFNLHRLLHGASVDGDPVVAAGTAMARARASGRFTRYDGNLAGAGVPPPSGAEVTSATRLEAWAACPFRYFAEVVLGVSVPDNPERALQMTPLEKGSLVHEVLERFVRGVIAGEPSDAAHLDAAADAVFAEYEARGVTGRGLFWQRDRSQLRRDLHELLARDACDASTPVRTELRFGLPEPVRVDLGDGRVIAFRGAIDRVDEAPGGGLVVIDYKTGGSARYAGLGAEDPTAGGRRFQLPVYAEAARAALGRPRAPVHAEYRFVTAKGKFQRIGYDVDDDVLARVGATLGAVDGMIGAGVFPPVPTAETFLPFVECPFCDPDGLGPGDRRREWERKRGAPELGAFRELFGDA
jgi:RecB family exonuclease